MQALPWGPTLLPFCILLWPKRYHVHYLLKKGIPLLHLTMKIMSKCTGENQVLNTTAIRCIYLKYFNLRPVEIPKWQTFLPFHISQLVKSLLFYILEAWTKVLFSSRASPYRPILDPPYSLGPTCTGDLRSVWLFVTCAQGLKRETTYQPHCQISFRLCNQYMKFCHWDSKIMWIQLQGNLVLLSSK